MLSSLSYYLMNEYACDVDSTHIIAIVTNMTYTYEKGNLTFSMEGFHSDCIVLRYSVVHEGFAALLPNEN